MRGEKLTRLFGKKTIYISGGSSGIGLACAKLLVPHASRLVLIARDTSRLKSAEELLCQQGGAEVDTISVSVDDTQAVKLSMERALKRIGPPDVLIHSAGYSFPDRFESLSDEKLRHMFDVNLVGTWNILRSITPALQSSAVVVSVASFAALLGISGYSAYAASKYAVLGLCEALRNELKPRGIAMKVVCPSDVDTPQLAYENQHKPPETSAIANTVHPFSAEYVAGYILNRVYRRRFLIVPGIYPKVIWFVKRIWPSLVYGILDSKLKNYFAVST